MIFPQKSSKFVLMQVENNTINEDTEVCPKCVGAKNLFTVGGNLQECNLCEGKGQVNEDVSNYFIRNIETNQFISE